jgi:hypothetical protein
VDATGSGSCPVTDFGVDCVEASGSSITVFVAWCNFSRKVALACYVYRATAQRRV